MSARTGSMRGVRSWVGSSDVWWANATDVLVGAVRGFVVLRIGDFPDVDDELVLPGRPHRHRHPHRPAVLVEAGAEDLEDRGVMRDVEEGFLVRVGAAR